MKRGPVFSLLRGAALGYGLMASGFGYLVLDSMIRSNYGGVVNLSDVPLAPFFAALIIGAALGLSGVTALVWWVLGAPRA